MTAPSPDSRLELLLRVEDADPGPAVDFRQRILRAVDVLESTAWERMLVRIEASDLRALAIAGDDSGRELEQVVGLASKLADAYGYEHTTIGLLVVALAVTSCLEPDRKSEVAAVVGEAFDISTLEDLDATARRLLAPGSQHEPRSDPPEADDLISAKIRTMPEVDSWYSESAEAAFTAAQRRARSWQGTAAIVMVVVAVANGDWWALPFALAVFLHTRDPLTLPEPSTPAVGRGAGVATETRALKTPLMAVAAVAAGLLGHELAAWVLTMLALMLELNAVRGERQLGRGAKFWGKGADHLPQAVHRLGGANSEYFAQRYATVVRTSALAALPSLLISVLLLNPIPFLLAMYTARGRIMFAAIVSTVSVTVLELRWEVVLGVLLSGLVGRAVLVWQMRAPVLHVPVTLPFGAVLTRHGRRLLRARHALAHDRELTAIELLEYPCQQRWVAHHRVLESWVRLSAGEIGLALQLATEARSTSEIRRYTLLEYTAVLIEARCFVEMVDFAAAETRLALLREAAGRGALGWPMLAETVLTDVGAAHRGDDPTVYTELAARLVPGRWTPTTLLLRSALIRACALTVEQENPRLAQRLLAVELEILNNGGRSREARLGVRGSGAVEFARAVTAMWRTLPVDMGGDEEAQEVLGVDDGAAGLLLHIRRPMEAVEALDVLARNELARSGSESEGLKALLEAIAVLNAVRHELRYPRQRAQWALRFEQVLADALDQALAQGEYALVAELIEVGRLQGEPNAGRESVNDETSARLGEAAGALGILPVTPAPQVRVRGRSRIEEATWFPRGAVPQALDLEACAAAAAGPGAWWWASWSNGTVLYWALIPPVGDVVGGRLEMHEGTPLARVLRSVATAVPVRQIGEGGEAFDARLSRSPLVRGPAEAEEALAEELGSLIPPTLAAALSGAISPVPIALAPAQVLGHVPWAVLMVRGDGRRLVEAARLVIAPPVSLLDAIAQRGNHQDRMTVGLAVLDPGHDLPGAAALAEELRPTCVVLPNRGATGVTLEEVGEALRATSRASTVVFACHTEPGRDGASSGGLRLHRTGTTRELLTARLLLTKTEEFPIPEQAVVLACDSGDLGSTEAGEWHTLGPAMLWAGANRAIVTTFPVVDAASVDADLLVAIDEGECMAEALRAVQLEQLALWRAGVTAAGHSGVPAGAPVLWSGHAPLGAYGDLAMARRPVHRAGQREVTPYTLQLLDTAGQLARQSGSEALTMRHLVHATLIWGSYDLHISAWRKLILSLALYPTALGYHAREKLRPTLRNRLKRIDDRVLATVHRAAEIGTDARMPRTDPEHIIVSVLRDPKWKYHPFMWLLGLHTAESRRDLLMETLPSQEAIRPEPYAATHLTEDLVNQIETAVHG